MRSKNIKVCEVCDNRDKSTIDKHHIIPRPDPRCTHGLSNLAIICANCHRKVHAGEIIIEGVFATTAGTKLFWHEANKPWIVRPGIFLLADGTANIVEVEDE